MISACRLRVLSLLSCVIFAIPALAERLEFIPALNGKRVEGAEVCLFKAGDGTTPLDFYADTPEIRCLPADEVLDLPVGRWSYFLRHNSGLVSMEPSVITVRVPADPAVDNYTSTSVDMRQAATLDLASVVASLEPEESLALFISNAGTEVLPMVLPIAHGEKQTLVPANIPLHVLRLHNGRVTNVSDAILLSASKQATLPEFPALRADSATVLTWVTFPEEFRQPGEHWAGIKAPEVVLMSGSRRFEAAIPARPGFGADGALFVFRGVPLGQAVLGVSGRTWAPKKVTLKVSPGLVVAPEGLTTHPTAAIDFAWSLGTAPNPPPSGTCGPSEPSGTVNTATTARLYACDAYQFGASPDGIDLKTCRMVAQPTRVDSTRRTLAFDPIPPGTYIVAFREGALPLHREGVVVGLGERASLHATIEAFNVFGSVRLDGRAIRARVTFATGSTVADESGEYYAALPKAPRDLPVKIVDCESGKTLHTHIPRAPLRPNERYDIAIKPNRVEILVVDAMSRRPVADATVQVGVLTGDDNDSGHFVGAVPLTDQHGKTRVENVPSGFPVVVCATSPAHDRSCAPSFKAEKREHSVTVPLAGKGVVLGRLIGAPRGVNGWVFVVTAEGLLADRARMNGDGTFQLKQRYQPPMYAVVASAELPLIVAPISSGDGPLDIHIPRAPVKRLTLSRERGKSSDAMIVGLYVGGVYVPALALSWHQDLRQLPSDLNGRGPLHIPDILATAPLSAVLGPSIFDLPRNAPPGTDFLANRATARSVPKVPDAAGRIVF